MSAMGEAVTMAGTATTTESPVLIPQRKRGAPGPVIGSTYTPSTPKARSRFLKETVVQNRDDTNSLLVRVNRGSGVYTIEPNKSLDLRHVIIHSLSVASSAATAAYDVAAVAS